MNPQPISHRSAGRDGCNHELYEMEAAYAADGLCPLCLQTRLTAVLEQVEHLSQYAHCSKQMKDDGIAHGGAAVCQSCHNTALEAKEKTLNNARHDLHVIYEECRGNPQNLSVGLKGWTITYQKVKESVEEWGKFSKKHAQLADDLLKNLANEDALRAQLTQAQAENAKLRQRINISDCCEAPIIDGGLLEGVKIKICSQCGKIKSPSLRSTQGLYSPSILKRMSKQKRDNINQTRTP